MQAGDIARGNIGRAAFLIRPADAEFEGAGLRQRYLALEAQIAADAAVDLFVEIAVADEAVAVAIGAGKAQLHLLRKRRVDHAVRRPGEAVADADCRFAAPFGRGIIGHHVDRPARSGAAEQRALRAFQYLDGGNVIGAEREQLRIGEREAIDDIGDGWRLVAIGRNAAHRDHVGARILIVDHEDAGRGRDELIYRGEFARGDIGRCVDGDAVGHRDDGLGAAAGGDGDVPAFVDVRSLPRERRRWERHAGERAGESR